MCSYLMWLPAAPYIDHSAMLLDFFLRLKNSKIPVTLMEFLTLLEALTQHLAFGSAEEFYYLARLCLIKDESNYDVFDRLFAEHFHGISNPLEDVSGTIL